MEKILKMCDIYGSDFTLRINGESKFKSVLGGFLSILTFLVFTWATLEFGQDFYLRNNPYVSMEDGIYDYKSIPMINGTSYPEKTVVMFYNKNFDKVAVPYAFIGNTENITLIPECDPEYLLKENIVPSLPLIQSYVYRCLNLNDFIIGARKYMSSNKMPLMTSWFSCSDLSDDDKLTYNITTCDSNFNETLDIMYFTLYYKKIGFNQNYNDPFISNYAAETNVLTSDKVNTLYYDLQIYNLEDDQGWISQNIVNSFDANIVPSTPLITPNTEQSRSVTPYVVFAVSDDYKTFTRSYMKFQDFLAKLGGFMKLVLMVLNFICFLIRIYLIDNYIVQKLFDHEVIIGNNLNIPNKSMINQSNYFADRSGGALFKVNNSNLPEINANEIKEIPIRKENFTVNNFQMIKDNSSEFRSARVNNVANYRNEFKNDFGELSKKVELKSKISLGKPELERKKTLTKSSTEIKKPSTTISVAQYIPATLYNLLGKSFDSSTDRGRRLEQARNKILIAEKVRDFDHILMKMNELEAMQNMIFNENQKICLSYMQKPKQTEDDTLKKLKTLKADPEDNLLRLEAYFSRLLRENEGNLHGYDAHLFNNLEQQIRTKIISNAA